MTTITVELPDDLAARVSQAGLLSSPAIASLIASAMAHLDADPRHFEQAIAASVAQADSVDAQWFTHAEVMAEWAAERLALLSGQPLPAHDA